MAATKIGGIPTLWAVVRDIWGREKPAGTWGVAIFQDLNGDGDAMDNAQVTGTRNEWRYVYDASDVTSTDPYPFDDPFGGWTDLELVRNADNHMFLLVSNTGSNWFYGNGMYVLQLDDNGDYTGGNDNFKPIYFGGRAEANRCPLTGFNLSGDFEFDSIPEPTTVLLLGTGALGVLAHFRRRRTR
jgi:hypothetical protein